MDILTQVQHVKPSSFSAREQQRYRAEKMLMRQFVLMKLQNQVPVYLHVRDMKNWLLHGRSFLEEFQGTERGSEARNLLLAELAWTSARRHCLNQMEEELWEELKREKLLSLRLQRKVTLEGLQMFLSIIRPKAEQDVQTFLGHLSNELLSSVSGSHISTCSRLALLAKLQRTTAPLVPQVVGTALEVLLDDLKPLAEVRTSQAEGAVTGGDSGSASALRNRAVSALIGQQLADAAAKCFCLNTSFTRAHLLRSCTSAARDMVKAISKRFVDRCSTFHLMDFDESAITAGESVACAIQNMDNRVQSAACNWALRQLQKKPTVVSPANRAATPSKHKCLCSEDLC